MLPAAVAAWRPTSSNATAGVLAGAVAASREAPSTTTIGVLAGAAPAWRQTPPTTTIGGLLIEEAMSLRAHASDASFSAAASAWSGVRRTLTGGVVVWYWCPRCGQRAPPVAQRE